MKWEDLTTEEFVNISRATPVIINVAAIEQHGPHLPLRTDATIGAHFLDILHERLGDDVLILPQVKVCCSDHHMDFAGTLSVRHETFLIYVSDILQSVIKHGFYNIIIFNSHGGNQAIGQVLIEKLGATNPGIRFVMLTWWQLARPELEDIRESGPGGVGHACEFETSLMLEIAPETVRQPLSRCFPYVTSYDWADGDMLISERGLLFRTMAEKTDGIGVMGDPSLATAQKGEEITDVVLNMLVKVVLSLSEKSCEEESL